MQIKIENKDDWNNAEELDGVSADINDEAGDLGIGYPSGRSDVETTLPGYIDLILQYRFDSSSYSDGDTIEDYSGESLQGTVNDSGTGASSESGILGTNSIFFNDSEVTVGDIDSEFDESQYTISMWFWPQHDNGPTSSYGLWDFNGEKDNGLLYRTDPQRLEFRTDGTTTRTDWAGNIPVQEWNHIVVTFSEDDEVNFYLNGENVHSESLGSHTEAPNDFRVGDNTDSDIGKVSDFMIFSNKVLTESEVRQLYFDGFEDDTLEGVYTSEIFEPEGGDEVEWEDIEITADIDASGSCDVEVKALDQDDNEIDSTIIEVEDGTDTYDISGLSDSPKIQIESTHEVDIS